LIEPSLKGLDLKAEYTAALAAAIEANVRCSVRQLTGKIGEKKDKDGRRIMVAGAVYELNTGRVRILTT
jgi:hypothetical protein